MACVSTVRDVCNLIPNTTLKGETGSIVSFGDNGSGGTTVTLTIAPMGLFNTSFVLIDSLTYFGEYAIFNVNPVTPSFDIPVVFSITETGAFTDVTIIKAMHDPACDFVTQLCATCPNLVNKSASITKQIEIYYTLYTISMVDTQSGVNIRSQSIDGHYSVAFNKSSNDSIKNGYYTTANMYSGGCLDWYLTNGNILPYIISFGSADVLDCDDSAQNRLREDYLDC